MDDPNNPYSPFKVDTFSPSPLDFSPKIVCIFSTTNTTRYATLTSVATIFILLYKPMSLFGCGGCCCPLQNAHRPQSNQWVFLDITNGYNNGGTQQHPNAPNMMWKLKIPSTSFTAKAHRLSDRGSKQETKQAKLHNRASDRNKIRIEPGYHGNQHTRFRRAS